MVGREATLLTVLHVSLPPPRHRGTNTEGQALEVADEREGRKSGAVLTRRGRLGSGAGAPELRFLAHLLYASHTFA